KCRRVALKVTRAPRWLNGRRLHHLPFREPLTKRLAGDALTLGRAWRRRRRVELNCPSMALIVAPRRSRGASRMLLPRQLDARPSPHRAAEISGLGSRTGSN